MRCLHYGDAIMDTMASQITSLTIVYSTVYSGADQRRHQSSASLAFMRGIHRGPVNSPHKWPVTRKTFRWRHHVVPTRFEMHIVLVLCGLSMHVSVRTKWSPICRQYFKMHFVEWLSLYLIQILPKLRPKGPVNHSSVLVQLMAWYLTGASLY